MLKHRFYLCILLLLLSMAWIHSCSDDESDTFHEGKSPFLPESVEVHEFLKGHPLRALDLEKSFGHSSLKMEYIRSSDSESRLNIDWESLQRFDDEEEAEILMYTLKSETPQLGLVHTSEHGKKKTRVGNATSKLVIWKTDKMLVGRIFTYLPDNHFSGNPDNKISDLGYSLAGSGFSGLLLVSTLDGLLLYGDKYDKGEYIYHFMPRNQYDESCHCHDSACAHEHPNELEGYHLYFRLFSRGNPLTRSASTYSTTESDGFCCSICRLPADLCTCVTITPPIVIKCPRCGFQYCICCSECRQYPCRCCRSCFHYPCRCCSVCHFYPCICLNIGGGNTGGGGIGGGNPTPDPTPDPDPKPNPDPKPETFDKVISCPIEYFPGYSKTMHCMNTCKHLLNKMFGGYVETSRIQLYKEINKELILVGDVDRVFKTMSDQLDLGKPLIAGLDYRTGSPGNADNTTDHFVLINGKGYHEGLGMYYFSYIETGRSKQEAKEAINDSRNRLYYDKANGTFTGPKWWAVDRIKPVYKLVQIRTIK